MTRSVGPRPSPPASAGPARAARQAGGAREEGANPSIDRESPSVALRLAIGKDGLGLELARPARLACLDVSELVVRLPHVRFPFDVSGGVAKFRHKRGELERLTVELDTRKLARWAEPKLRGLLSAGPCSVSVEARRLGVTVTVWGRTTKAAAHAHVAALAFEASLLTSGDDLVVVVHEARGTNLASPPTALAIRAMATLLGGAASREGSRFVLSKPTTQLAKHLLPEAGVRTPGADDVRLSGTGEADGVLVFALVRDGAPIEIQPEATLASEVAALVREGDNARFTGDFERARALDVAALERAPRHPEIARRIAEIDGLAGKRAEAALATLRAAAGSERLHLATLGGELALEAGDTSSAIAWFLRAAEREPSHVVSALTHAAAAHVTKDPYDALAWLDEAVARAPRLAELRWERAKRRLEGGRLEDAKADLQELEAMADGTRERLDVLRRGADLYRSVGLGDAAADLYERALLYRPDDPAALAGLGVALAQEGRHARGAALLAHAVEVAGARGEPTAWMDLELARILGEQLRDRPAAVARLRAIPDEAKEAIFARGLEGRLRGVLGDFAGASLAFARLRERAGHEEAALPWLLEAANFEASRGDLHAAQRHAGAALAISPKDDALLALHRDLGERIAGVAGLKPAPLPAPSVVELGTPDATASPRVELEPAFEPAAPPELDEAQAEERVESLTRAVQADPTNDAAVDELVVLLSRLGRSMELLALLSARLEDAPPDRRDELLPKHRETLKVLEAEARAAGREAEADLFRMAHDAS